MRYRYRLQRKEDWYMPYNVGDCRTTRTLTYRWVDIAVSDDRDALEAIIPKNAKYGEYRVIDTDKRTWD